MDSQGFLPRLDHFKTTAEKLFHDCNDPEPNATPGVFGRAWLRGFLDRHPAVSARSLHPGPPVCICEPFWPYKGLLQKAKAAIAKCRIQEKEDNVRGAAITHGVAITHAKIARRNHKPHHRIFRYSTTMIATDLRIGTQIEQVLPVII